MLHLPVRENNFKRLLQIPGYILIYLLWSINYYIINN